MLEQHAAREGRADAADRLHRVAQPGGEPRLVGVRVRIRARVRVRVRVR
jgi:hypothetical protein